MQCTNPLTGFRPSPDAENRKLVYNHRNGMADRPISHPCGSCLNCRINARAFMALRCVLEARMHPPGSCWASTLTYDNEHLPRSGSLSIPTIQAFKRHCADTGFGHRSLIAGEYGEQLGRPHYHGLHFGLSLDDLIPAGKGPAGDVFYSSARLTSLWGRGLATVYPLTHDTAGYAASYAEKRVTGDDAEIHYETVHPLTGEFFQLQREFALSSSKPGIGLPWFLKFKAEVLASGFIVHNGEKYPIPPYFLRHVSEADRLALKVKAAPKINSGRKAERLAHEAANPNPLHSTSRQFTRHQISKLKHQARVRDVGGTV